MNFLPKDYVSVATRVDQFHTDHEKDISIDTNFTLQGDVACFKAIVKTKKGTFSGSSFGKLGREKAFEKLETVAVGRALAFAGYETRDGIASKEEMEVFESNENDRNNAPISNYVPQEAKVYPKSALDEVMEQMEYETDIEHLKTLYALGLDRVKSEKQKAFFDSFKEKQKKRILSLNVHTA